MKGGEGGDYILLHKIIIFFILIIVIKLFTNDKTKQSGFSLIVFFPGHSSRLLFLHHIFPAHKIDMLPKQEFYILASDLIRKRQ